jgi:hypothetical protein
MVMDATLGGQRRETLPRVDVVEDDEIARWREENRRRRRRQASEAPERSLEQRMGRVEARERDRSARAQLKRDIKAGRRSIHDLLLEPPEYTETMKVFDALIVGAEVRAREGQQATAAVPHQSVKDDRGAVAAAADRARVHAAAMTVDLFDVKTRGSGDRAGAGHRGGPDVAALELRDRQLRRWHRAGAGGDRVHAGGCCRCDDARRVVDGAAGDGAMKRRARDLRRAYGLAHDPRERVRLSEALVRLYTRRAIVAAVVAAVLCVVAVVLAVIA